MPAEPSPARWRGWRDLPLVCPVCRLPLELGAAEIVCRGCAARYPVVEHVPALFPPAPADRTMTANNRVYDDLAESYDETLPGHVVRHYLRKRLRFIAGVAPAPRHGERRTLDVGCGTGVVAQALARGGDAVVGVDISLGMLGVMYRRGGTIPIGASGTDLPFPDGLFDLTVSVAAFHHISDADKVAATLGEIWRTLRPGGVAVIWDHNPDNPYWPLLLKRMPQDEEVERLVPGDELIGGLVAAGARPADIVQRQLGFIPDFAPAALMPLARQLERTAERAPLLRRLAAHNVVVARKPDPGR